jgi:hypothetical protein
MQAHPYMTVAAITAGAAVIWFVVHMIINKNKGKENASIYQDEAPVDPSVVRGDNLETELVEVPVVVGSDPRSGSDSSELR